VKRGLLAAAVLAAAVVVVAIASLPPALEPLSTSRSDGTVPGVIHIHTTRSDGSGSPEDIAGAAAQAGLKFIVFTDHGDATRRPDAPVYRNGVLCIDAVEISTSGGHYIAIGMPAAPYPLGGDPQGVVEDVARLGGFGYPAHPDSPRDTLRWRDWDAAIDALEIVNPDTSWRLRTVGSGIRPKWQLVESVLGYPVRPVETIARLLTDASENLARWDSLTKTRSIVGLSGADAHANLLDAIHLPSYAASLRTVSVHVRPDAALTGDAARDADAILQALRAGHVYTTVDGLAGPPFFEFIAEGSSQRIDQGDTVPAGVPLTLRVRSNAPAGFNTTVLKDGQTVQTSDAPDFTVALGAEPGVYRAEIVSSQNGNARWLIGNPIYVRGVDDSAASAVVPQIVDVLTLFDGTSSRWRAESDGASAADIDLVPEQEGTSGQALRMRYRLGSSESLDVYAGVLIETESAITGTDRVTFTARADRPTRISLQLRTAIHGKGPEERWQRSVYLDQVDRELTIPFSEMSPVGTTRTGEPALSEIRDVMFVVDTTNTRPGSSGEIVVSNAVLQRSR
jgi:hypothetical protein